MDKLECAVRVLEATDYNDHTMDDVRKAAATIVGERLTPPKRVEPDVAFCVSFLESYWSPFTSEDGDCGSWIFDRKAEANRLASLVRRLHENGHLK
jgi:hypothetical protein